MVRELLMNVTLMFCGLVPLVPAVAAEPALPVALPGTVALDWPEEDLSGRMMDVSGSGYEPRGDFSRAGAILAPTGQLRRLLTAGVLASDAYLVRTDEGRWQLKGDPTEGALIVAAAKAGLSKSELDAKYPRVSEIPFSSETKRMTTLHAGPEGTTAYAKGAPEVILSSCTKLMTSGAPRP